jgi:hypothetical protein
MAIGGASEMAVQAERRGASIDRVAAAHSLRMMMVALIVAIVLQAAGAQGTEVYVPAAREFNAAGLIVLAACRVAATSALAVVGSGSTPGRPL